jgi:hypothetical protein
VIELNQIQEQEMQTCLSKRRSQVSDNEDTEKEKALEPRSFDEKQARTFAKDSVKDLPYIFHRRGLLLG